MGNEFRTHDLGLASFLVASGRRLLRLDGPSGRRMFSFADVPDSDVSDFLNGKAVDARQLLYTHRMLKGLLLAEVGRR